MKIGILTMFRTLRTSYSLVTIVESQIRLLLEKGHQVRLVVSEACRQEERYGSYLDKRLEWVEITNYCNSKEMIWYDYSNLGCPLHETLDEEVEITSQSLIDALKDVDVCIMHDILYQGLHYMHNLAIRKAQPSLKEVGFIEWTHSFPYEPPIHLDKCLVPFFSPMPKTLFVFPSLGGISALSKQYQVPEGRCRVVYHTYNAVQHMNKIIQHLEKKYSLTDADILINYPARLSEGKKLDKVVSLAGALKTVGEIEVKVVFCDSYKDEVEGNRYKRFVRSIGVQYGLEEKDIIFTSDEGYTKGIPRVVVLQLFQLSNTYICPSLSEAFGLGVQEAAATGNFLILNENVPALREIGHLLNVYFMKWDGRIEGGTKEECYEPSEATYYGRHAKNILDQIQSNSIICQKRIILKKFSEESIWYNQFQPLLNEAQKMGKENT